MQKGEKLEEKEDMVPCGNPLERGWKLILTKKKNADCLYSDATQETHICKELRDFVLVTVDLREKKKQNNSGTRLTKVQLKQYIL